MNNYKNKYSYHIDDVISDVTEWEEVPPEDFLDLEEDDDLESYCYISLAITIFHSVVRTGEWKLMRRKNNNE